MLRISSKIYFYLPVLLMALIGQLSYSQKSANLYYFLDTSNVHLTLDKTSNDTIADPKNYHPLKQGQIILIFYDREFKNLMTEKFQLGDTTYRRQYYRNGQKKNETRSVNEWELVYDASWCENGQLIVERKDFSDRLQTFTFYYCNGKIKQQFQTYGGLDSWGTIRGWHENGQPSFEIQYPEFDEKLYQAGELKHNIIREIHRDVNGKIIKKYP